MTVDPTLVPGLTLLVAELVTLAAVGYVVARVALRQRDDLLALAQGMVIGPAIWGLAANFLLHLLPGRLGGAASWLVVVTLAGGLAWRGMRKLPVSARSLAGFAVVAVLLCWVGLSGWQTLAGPPDAVHLGLTSQIEVGGWPPTLPWNPWQSVPYHYGVDLVLALLAPPVGPDLPLTTEVFGAYVWTGLVLILAAVLRRTGGWAAALVLVPLLCTAGAWTLVLWVRPPDVLQIPLPVGLPAAGLRAALEATYWPDPLMPQAWPYDRVLPNIWTPWFVLSYALAAVVLERVAKVSGRPSNDLASGVTLGVLVGFLGLTDEAVAATVLTIWGVLVVALLVRRRGQDASIRSEALRAAAGPAVAAILLAVGGGVVTGVLTGAVGGGLSLEWADDPDSRGLLASIEPRGGGLGVLGLGPLVVTGVAVALGWRDRLVLALAAAGSVFLIAALTVRYELAAHDVARFDGHARNFALLAVVVGASVRLRCLRPRWGAAAAAGLLALVVWPTVAGPVRGTGDELGRGVYLANAEIGTGRHGKAFGLTRGSAFERPLGPALTAYVRSHTAVDARILSPWPQIVSVSTGRPNASGFMDFLHLLNLEGPEYLDAVRDLDPAALRRLGIDFVHAPEEWTGALPARALGWLSNPSYFELLARDGPDSLYRVQPAFLRLDVDPAPTSFEALRQEVPAFARVYLAPGNRDTVDEMRVASTLSHTHIHGTVWTGQLHPLTRFAIEPLGHAAPDIVVASWSLVPAAFEPEHRQPIWWNEAVVVYAPRGAVAPLMRPPKRSPDFGVRLSETTVTGGRVSFDATFTNRAPERWTGQDWLVTVGDGSPWALPPAAHSVTRPRAPAAQWFAGQLVPGHRETVFGYEFDPGAARLVVRDGAGQIVEAASSGRSLTVGDWTLSLRLRRDWHEVAFIPVMKVSVSETGQASYQIFDGELNVQLMQ